MADQLPLSDAGTFPILEHLSFLNHAAVAPISGPAAAAVRQYADQAAAKAYVDSSWYRRVGQIKGEVAKLMGAAGSGEIAYVPNTSSGLALVAKGISWVEGDNVVITNVEYPANRYPWQDLQRLGVQVIEVRQQPDGRIDAEDVCDAITSSTRVVSVSHVQYASGHRLELKPISDMVHRAGGYLCVDAIQSLGVLPVDVAEMGIDFLSADGHKWLLAPEGAGVFYCREDLCEMLHPNVVGWMSMVNAGDYGNYQFEFQKDARRFEPGSYNVAGILGLGASVQVLGQVGIAAIWQRVYALTSKLCGLLEERGYRIFSPRATEGECSGIVSFLPPEAKVRSTPPLQQIAADLEKQRIIIAVREGRLRVSPHYYNTDEQMEQMAAALP